MALISVKLIVYSKFVVKISETKLNDFYHLGFRTIVLIFMVISTTFRPICPPVFFRCLLSKFLRQSLMSFIIKGFWTIVFIFNVISTTFRLICPPAFFRCLSNSGTVRELQTTSFIKSTGVACSDSICHNWVQVSSRTHSITVIGVGSLSF